MQHKIPKQVKLTLWAVKKNSGEKGGGRDTTKVPPGEGPAGNVLFPWPGWCLHRCVYFVIIHCAVYLWIAPSSVCVL